MVSGNSKINPAADVVETELENGEAVLLHMGTRSYYSLNPTGLKIWQLLKEGLTLNEISLGIESEFDISQEEALNSVIRLTSELVDEKLASIVQS